jgi:hypothetical protein
VKFRVVLKLGFYKITFRTIFLVRSFQIRKSSLTYLSFPFVFSNFGKECERKGDCLLGSNWPVSVSPKEEKKDENWNFFFTWMLPHVVYACVFLISFRLPWQRDWIVRNSTFRTTEGVKNSILLVASLMVKTCKF